MSKRESAEQALERFALLEALQQHYANFTDFLRDGMELLGFTASEIQENIGDWMVNGPDSIMVQAQRGQAKTTVAALFSIWSLIHNPRYRILIVSAGSKQANEISTLIVRVIMSWDILDCMRPDAQAGDRTSVEHFDIHHSLKGIEKSPSVACVGITANLQGKRADILLADDVESQKNASTAIQRQQLAHLTLDFVSICMGLNGKPGRIIWLGTPQSVDSIYNSLPSRGVAVRIWPGRYPTPEEEEHYGEFLAPLIKRRMEANPELRTGGGILGDRGQPTDPSYLGEAVLQRKFLDQGEAYFQLQHMLNTRLTDAMRYPLKVERLVTLRLGTHRRVPLEVVPAMSAASLRHVQYGGTTFRVSNPASISQQFGTVPTLVMYVDPAGGGLNGDETGYAIVGMMAGTAYLFAWGGVPGGYDLPKLEALAEVAAKWKPEVVVIEKNMGYGAFAAVFLPVLRRKHPDCKVDEDLVTGGKEARILNTLEPVIGRGSLVINEEGFEDDWQSTQRYGSRALTYTLLHQIAKLTREKGALVHDDRLDAVEGAVRWLQRMLGVDSESERKRAEEAAYRKLREDPLGYNRYQAPPRRGSLLSRRLGR